MTSSSLRASQGDPLNQKVSWLSSATTDHSAGRQPSHALNIGILAHVDAGKTSLTERLLFDCGSISSMGSVESGNTTTDTHAIEVSRGITVRSSVVAFQRPGRQYNLIDTPGHTDFIAEVHRSLRVIDAAVLLVSATSGVQPQTRELMRLLRKEEVATVIMVNKIDAANARDNSVVDEICHDLDVLPIPVGQLSKGGTKSAHYAVPYDDADEQQRCAELLAEVDEGILAALVDDTPITGSELRKTLRRRTQSGQVCPLVFGSALTGAGIAVLLDVLDAVLVPRPPESTTRATVFAVERDERGRAEVLVRSYGGSLTTRDRIEVHRAVGGSEELTITSLGVVGPCHELGDPLTSGYVARVRASEELHVGDSLGTPAASDGHERQQVRAEPALTVTVRPRDPRQHGALHSALESLSDEDPSLAADTDRRGEAVLHLHGEVQREVVETTLLERFGLATVFAEPSIDYVERPQGTGTGLEVIGGDFLATVGLRVEPGEGYSYSREVELGSMALAFHEAVEATVVEALQQGCYGWPVVDVHVTMTHSGFWPRPYSAAGDYRDVTPLVLMQALGRATTRVYEPVHKFWIEVPTESLGSVTSVVTRHRGQVTDTQTRVDGWLLEGRLPAAEVNALRRALPASATGVTSWVSRPDGDQPVISKPPPTRPRNDGNPFDRVEYLRHLSQR